MYLKRLELKGFKSFPIKTDILFNKGITSIVGPNGSGKSNISDAVRWVLGEQSIKSLRGDKLEDVIFGGTDSKKRMNYCEVSLTIDNSENKLNIDFSEVTIKRRAYRSGESEFFLNGKSCRLKDIKELLLDTGIGKDGYSIIEQGKVDEILSNNPLNRRKVFDEACGISKFRYKKQEAERNLKNTKDNLERIDDIYIEIENQLNPLFSQQKKAKEYIELSERLRNIEVNTFIKEIEQLDIQIDELNKHTNILEKQSSEIEEKKLSIESSIIDNNKEVESIDENINKSQDYIDSIKSVISKKDGQLNLINEKIKNLNSSIIKNKSELSEIINKISLNNEFIKVLQSNKQDSEIRIADLQKKLSQLDELNISKKIEIENINDNIENLKDGIINILNEKQDYTNKLSTINANIENISNRDNSIDSEIKEAKKYIDEKVCEVDKIDLLLKEKNIELLNLNNQEEYNKTYLNNLIIKNEKVIKHIQDIRFSINNYNSKLSIYIDMENQNEGFNKGVKQVLKNNSLKGINGALGQIITTNVKYEKAIESSLGAYMQNIITDDENSAKLAIDYLKKNNFGRVTFLPINIIKPNKINITSIKSDISFIAIASELVECDKRYKNIVEHILGRTIVIENIDKAIKFAKETNHRYKIVTLDGEILNPGGSLTGGGFKNNINILSRKRIINEYSNKIKELNINLNLLLSEKDDNNKKISELKSNINRLKEEINLKEKNIIIEKSNKEKIYDQIKSIEINLSKLKSEKEGISSNLKYSLEKNNKVKSLIEEIDKNHMLNKAKIESLTLELKKLNILYENDKENYDKLNLELVRDKQIYETIKSDLIRIAKENEELKVKKETIDKLKEDQKQNIEKLSKQILKDESEKISLSNQLGNNIKNLENKKLAKYDLKKKLDELNNHIKNVNRQYIDLKESLFKVVGKQERLQSLKSEYITNLLEKYDLTIQEALKEKDNSIDINKKKLEEIKRQIRILGNINLDSIKEYEEVKGRYDFYSEQKQDLEQSIKAIESLIDDLEKNMKNEFKFRFEQINENFKMVYKRLFGGGEGELIILDLDNILESDIEIVAQPPGKKMKSLSLLSGGEKALTAISILFSIILAKPTPFCILDEIEAPLDDANIFRFGEFLKELSKDTQFITVTHRRGTMQASDYIYGVTMQEKAISKVLSLNLSEAKETIDVI